METDDAANAGPSAAAANVQSPKEETPPTLGELPPVVDQMLRDLEELDALVVPTTPSSLVTPGSPAGSTEPLPSLPRESDEDAIPNVQEMVGATSLTQVTDGGKLTVTSGESRRVSAASTATSVTTTSGSPRRRKSSMGRPHHHHLKQVVPAQYRQGIEEDVLEVSHSVHVSDWESSDEEMRGGMDSAEENMDLGHGSTSSHLSSSGDILEELPEEDEGEKEGEGASVVEHQVSLSEDFEEIALGGGGGGSGTDSKRSARGAIGQFLSNIRSGESAQQLSASAVSVSGGGARSTTRPGSASSNATNQGIFAFQRPSSGSKKSSASRGITSSIENLAKIVANLETARTGANTTAESQQGSPEKPLPSTETLDSSPAKAETGLGGNPSSSKTESTEHGPFVNVPYDELVMRKRGDGSFESPAALFTVTNPALTSTISPTTASRRPTSAATPIATYHSSHSKSTLEKEISFTRPRFLPPKNHEEDQKHMKEYQKMMREYQRKVEKEQKQRERRAKRRDDFFAKTVPIWEKTIFPNWEKWRMQKRLVDYWKYGLPPIVRGKVWRLIIGNRLGVNQEIFAKCKERATEILEASPEAPKETLSSPTTATSKGDTLQIITFDLDRTFPHLGLFQKERPFHDDLRQLLEAFVVYRPDIGYVQGMSFIAAIFLVNMNALDAFCTFCNLLHHPFHAALFGMDPEELQLYFRIFNALFRELMPALFRHFEQQHIEPNVYLLEWLLTVYTRSLPFDIASRLFDWYLLRGEVFLFQAGLGILKFFEDRFLRQDMDGNLYDLTHLPSKMDEEEFFLCVEAMYLSFPEYERVKEATKKDMEREELARKERKRLEEKPIPTPPPIAKDGESRLDLAREVDEHASTIAMHSVVLLDDVKGSVREGESHVREGESHVREGESHVREVNPNEGDDNNHDNDGIEDADNDE